MKFRTGLCIGKFLPPHRGHRFLIEAASEQSEKVVVIVCEKPGDPIPGELRAAWLREMHPNATVIRIDDTFDADDDSALWARLTIGWLGAAPDAVFTSEEYGHTYAREMGCRHVQVDKARVAVPCSGTAIRSQPFAYWEFLDPPVREWFARRVCVLGAESTGTTTLAQALAERLNTVWVPEFGREYSAEKQAKGETEWRTPEFLHISRTQNCMENAAARQVNRILICDTNSFATWLWHRRYVGHDSDEVLRVSATQPCHLYLLTGDEIPFVQDGLRDGEHIRHEMHGWFIDSLQRQEIPWQLVTGSPQDRLEQAMEAIGGLFKGSHWQPAQDSR